MKRPSNTRPRPAYVARVGTIHAHVHRSTTAAGTSYTITCWRMFRRAGTWHRRQDFASEDLPALAQTLARVQSWLHTQPDRQLWPSLRHHLGCKPAALPVLCALGTPAPGNAGVRPATRI